MLKLIFLVSFICLFAGFQAEGVTGTPPPSNQPPVTQPATDVPIESCSTPVCILQQFAEQFMEIIQQIYNSLGYPGIEEKEKVQ
ncbi:Protein CBG26556 [Caenorhabditis briggsae]|uniref:Uncharacterized protein n=2 Tax=Caenorhabditis briggsae TaxID=6238 RepID=A0AAE9A8Z6_CAEBR|nr:Protein CBG26556 [Caenorhabditis briggsae]ULT93662.1 hypothetical protein L3Y34_003274 [Caenorhabditis briggsae]UMM26928.1 hypothetical protein L5515_010427 [Caenorhabditis briggsae]CAS00954.1 Protein CBG26556 [Caenorhabditis briggsae]